MSNDRKIYPIFWNAGLKALETSATSAVLASPVQLESGQTAEIHWTLINNDSPRTAFVIPAGSTLMAGISNRFDAGADALALAENDVFMLGDMTGEALADGKVACRIDLDKIEIERAINSSKFIKAWVTLWYTPTGLPAVVAGVMPICLLAPSVGHSPGATSLTDPLYWKKTELPAATDAEIIAGTEAALKASSPAQLKLAAETHGGGGGGSGDVTEVQVSGGVLTVSAGTGPVPIVGLTAAAIQTAAAALPLAGGTMTGALNVGANRFTAGAEMDFTGAGAISPLAMGDNKITAVGTPSAGTDAANKDYSDLKLPLAGGTLTGPVTLATSATPSAPAAGSYTLYYDGTNLIGIDAAGVTTEIA